MFRPLAPASTQSTVSACFCWVSVTYRSSEGLRAVELGDALVLVGAVVHLICIRRTRTESIQTAHTPLWKGIHQSCNLDVTYV
jgi:hypothetical protein